jgi:drug/metabolite transporter (DMT)-like permease
MASPSEETQNTLIQVKIRRERVIADASLLLVALIWGGAFVAQRIAAQEIGVFIFNGLRFLIGAAVVLPLIKFSSNRDKHPGDASRLELQTTAGLILAGCLLVLGSGFQQAGLKYTNAGNAGFITGLYVVLIPLFLAVFWRRKPRPVIWLAALMAAMGLFLLSTNGSMQFQQGDGLVLISAIFWALHVILIEWMVQRMNILSFAAGQFLICGILSLSLGLLIENQSMKSLLDYGWVILYTGVFSVGLGYTLQAFGQRQAPPADAAIILSMEAVFAALAGWFILQETLSPIQLVGCGIMLAGMLIAQSDAVFTRRGGN